MHATHEHPATRPSTTFPTRAALAVAGVLFVAYPAIRPFSDERSLAGAAAFASTSWLVAHSLAVVGFVVLALGLFGVAQRLHGSAGGRLATRAAVVAGAGIGLTLPFYGAEVFGLHAIGREALRRHDQMLVKMSDTVRFGVGIVFIVAGLVLLAVATGMLARAVWRAGVLPRSSGIVLAVAFALYLPQFSAPQPIRVAHGLLVLVGCLALARGLQRADASRTTVAAAPAVPTARRDDALEIPVGAAR